MTKIEFLLLVLLEDLDVVLLLFHVDFLGFFLFEMPG